MKAPGGGPMEFLLILSATGANSQCTSTNIMMALHIIYRCSNNNSTVGKLLKYTCI